MRKITANIVFPVASDPIPNGVVIVDASGQIRALDTRENHDPASLDAHRGILVPGFVNTHCHLELSHMQGKVDTGTGLIPFIDSVVKFRDFPEEIIQDAIDRADREMHEAGIVAVGDISNKADTASRKARSPIAYYTFVEMFDFLQDSLSASTFERYEAVFEAQSSDGHNKKSRVPHAPYTVSPSLFQRINVANTTPCTVSIHNQETAHEDRLFLEKAGDFLDFYRNFGFSLEAFSAIGSTAIRYALTHLDADQQNLFVHNTFTTLDDIHAAHAWSDRVFWATCPNANLYIENRLPDYAIFMEENARLTIGTDSLTSNWQLSILEEMKTIQRYQSFVPFEIMLKWATLNGAEALGYDHLGALVQGKSPGLNLIELDDVDAGIDLSGSRVRRLI